jgi:tripartite-type tricarboxylate transporter receptor subunit TctC
MMRAFAAALAVLASSAAGPLAAQGFPEKPVRIVVNFPPGGPSDILARSLGDKMAATLKQPFIVESRPGAGGNIGAEAVARSPADGHTVLFSIDTTFTVNPNLYGSMPFKLAELKPVMLTASSGLAVGVNPSVGATSFEDFVSKGKSTTIAFSSGSNGSPGHVAASILQQTAGVKVNHVPYKGNTPAVMALVSGEVQAGILATPGLLPHVKAGKVKAVAVTSTKRSPLLPDVPTAAEAGVPGLEVSTWQAVFAPAGTPKPVVQRLNAEFAKAMRAPEVRARFLDMVLEADGGPPEKLAEYQKAEIAKWAKVVKEQGVKPD